MVIAPVIISAGLLALAVADEGSLRSIGHEGIAYLMAFIGFSLPGLLLAMLVNWYVQARAAYVALPVRLVLASLVGTVVSCFAFWLVLSAIAQSLTADPAVFVLPALIGITGCLIFTALPPRRVEA